MNIEKILNQLSELFQKGELNNDDLVQIIDPQSSMI
jgi:hypothetical protein